MKADQKANVDNRGARYAGNANVQNIAINTSTQTLNGGTVFYPPRRDVAFNEHLSKLVFDFLGENQTRWARAATYILGGSSAFAGLFSVTPLAPEFLQATSALIVVGIGLLAVGGLLSSAISHREERRCEKCRAYYAIKEVGEPVGVESVLSTCIKRKTDRHYKCTHCGHSFTRTEYEEIEHPQGS